MRNILVGVVILFVIGLSFANESPTIRKKRGMPGGGGSGAGGGMMDMAQRAGNEK